MVGSRTALVAGQQDSAESATTRLTSDRITGQIQVGIQLWINQKSYGTFIPVHTG